MTRRRSSAKGAVLDEQVLRRPESAEQRIPGAKLSRRLTHGAV